MMKNSIKTLFLALLLCTGVATTSMAQQERAVSNFNGVAINGSIKTIIHIGNQESLRFEGDQEAIDELITEVKGGVLIIRSKNKWGEWNRKFRNRPITAHITAKRITSLTMSGSGSIDVQGVITSNELAATVSGSGIIRASANVKSLNAVISGSGNLSLQGKANDANITIGGSGNFRGGELKTITASTTISGSGSIYISADKKLNAVVSGSGNVNYTGSPEVEKTVVGSGGVRKS
jgi:hypothetical protein